VRPPYLPLIAAQWVKMAVLHRQAASVDLTFKNDVGVSH
jgi:hypothetical protein